MRDRLRRTDDARSSGEKHAQADGALHQRMFVVQLAALLFHGCDGEPLRAHPAFRQVRQAPRQPIEPASR
jgi:hypothetical protein